MLMDRRLRHSVPNGIVQEQSLFPGSICGRSNRSYFQVDFLFRIGSALLLDYYDLLHHQHRTFTPISARTGLSASQLRIESCLCIRDRYCSDRGTHLTSCREQNNAASVLQQDGFNALDRTIQNFIKRLRCTKATVVR